MYRPIGLVDKLLCNSEYKDNRKIIVDNDSKKDKMFYFISYYKSFYFLL